MFPSRLSLHFGLKQIESTIAQQLGLQVVEQVAIKQKFVRAGETPAPIETLNLCRQPDQQYVVVVGTGTVVEILPKDRLLVLIETLSERDRFPAERYLKSIDLKANSPAV